MKALAGLLAVLVAVVHFRIWVHDDGFPGVWRLRQAVAAQRVENEGLRARNQRLLAEVRDLRDGLEAIEGRARRDLGLVRADETFYHVIER